MQLEESTLRVIAFFMCTSNILVMIFFIIREAYRKKSARPRPRDGGEGGEPARFIFPDVPPMGGAPLNDLLTDRPLGTQPKVPRPVVPVES